MEIKRLKFITFILIIIVISILLGVVLFHTDYFKQTYIEPTPIEELLQKSDYCVRISTNPGKNSGRCGSYIDPEDEWPPKAETVEKNGKYYIEVYISHSGTQSIKGKKLIYIIQENFPYIKAEKHYLVFLKKSETEENCYYIVDEPNGIIEYDFKNNVFTINPKMKDEVSKEIGNTCSDLDAWYKKSLHDIK